MRITLILPAAAAILFTGPGCVSSETGDDGIQDGVLERMDEGDACTAGGDGDAGATQAREFVGTDGGTVTLLHFGAFSDSQPAEMNRDEGFPSSVADAIFSHFSRLGTQFVVGAGDWMFASTAAHAEKQLSLLLASESVYGGPVFHAMGNHECMTAGASNCPHEDESPNVVAYKRALLPFSEHSWFSFDLRTSMGTARFVFTSTNAWDNELQGRWLHSVLGRPADYIFVVQHASDFSSGADTPGAVKALEIARQYPVTLFIFGHAHLYRRLGPNELIIGTGGGALNGDGRFFGFAVVDQLKDGNVRVTVYDDGGKARDAWTISPLGEAMD